MKIRTCFVSNSSSSSYIISVKEDRLTDLTDDEIKSHIQKNWGVESEVISKKELKRVIKNIRKYFKEFIGGSGNIDEYFLKDDFSEELATSCYYIAQDIIVKLYKNDILLEQETGADWLGFLFGINKNLAKKILGE